MVQIPGDKDPSLQTYQLFMPFTGNLSRPDKRVAVNQLELKDGYLVTKSGEEVQQGISALSRVGKDEAILFGSFQKDYKNGNYAKISSDTLASGETNLVVSLYERNKPTLTVKVEVPKDAKWNGAFSSAVNSQEYNDLLAKHGGKPNDAFFGELSLSKAFELAMVCTLE
jgi:hypothetical protein